MQQSILEQFPNTDISISIVWIQMPGFNDNEITARKIARSIDDPRVKHFYDPFPAHFVGKEFAKNRLTSGPAWDIYFFYDKGEVWNDSPPEPVEWMHQLGGGVRADATKFRTGQDLVDQLHKTMHSLTEEKCRDD